MRVRQGVGLRRGPASPVRGGTVRAPRAATTTGRALSALALSVLASSVLALSGLSAPAAAVSRQAPAVGSSPAGTPATATAAAGAARTIPRASTHCTNPAHAGEPARRLGLQPQQLAAAYGLAPLWQHGYRGQGEKVAILLFSESLDPTKWQAYTDCWGPFKTPIQKVIGTGPQPQPGGEGVFDPESVVTAAPDAQIYMFESTGHPRNGALWPPLIEAALDPANTGGTLVDVITTSFDVCEALWDPAAVQATEAALRKAARLGVKVFADAGDSGSVGPTAATPTTHMCVGHPIDVSSPPPGATLGVGYPASSPYVTAVGGTELAINGTIPRAGSPRGGTISDEVVWNEEASGKPGWRFAGGGGTSTFFTIADAPWQRADGQRGAEGVPDLAALAGSPKYPDGGIGTSGATPFTAGGFAVVDGYLTAHGAKPVPAPLNPVLYRLARDPRRYARVFHDVVDGSNDLLGLGCCDAAVGYDTASGLGSIRFDELAATLLPPRPPHTSAAPTPSGRTAAPTPHTDVPQPRPTGSGGRQLAATGYQGLPTALLAGLGLVLGTLLLLVARRPAHAGRSRASTRRRFGRRH